MPDFDVSKIYDGVFSPNGIAVQMVQNVINWFGSTVMFFPFIMFYERLSPIFSPENKQRSLETVGRSFDTCNDSLMSIAKFLKFLLSILADFTDGVQR